MYVAQISFEIVKRKSLEKQHDTIQWLLGCWRNDGQILGREFVTRKEGGYWQIIVGVPARDAFYLRNYSQYSRRIINEELPKNGLALASTRIVGTDPPDWSPCTCKSPLAYVLFTNLISMESPLECLDCGGRVPLYRVPWPNDDQCHNVVFWQSNYQACDTLNMDCGFGERFGERQISDLNSGLSKEGRKICADIETLTGKPVYYYLHRHRGKSSTAEDARPCPNCGENWKLLEPLHKLYDFKCDNCRLLSNVAFNIRNP